MPFISGVGRKKTSYRELILFELRVLSPFNLAMFGVGLVSLVLGIVGLATAAGVWAIALAVIGLILGIVPLVLPIFSFDKVIIEDIATPERSKRLKSLVPEGSDWLLETIPDGTDGFEYSPNVDSWLRSDDCQDVPVIVDDAIRHDITSLLRANSTVNEKILRAHFARARREKSVFTDDKKVCLASSIHPEMTSAKIWHGSYYISTILNEPTRLVYLAGEGQEAILSDPGKVFDERLLDQYGALRPIPQSSTANHLGANTIILTEQGQLMVWVQGQKAQFSKGMLVPAGSGSFDPEDIDLGSLQQSAINAMERELVEESFYGSKFDPNWIVETKLVGFFRNLGRGGLPGFLGVTKLSADARIKPDKSEVVNPANVDTIWPAATPEELSKSIQDLLANHRTSTALYANLRALEEAIHAGWEL